MQQSFESLITALQFFPLHRERCIEQHDHGLRDARGRTFRRSRSAPESQQSFCLEKAGLVRTANRCSLGWRGLPADWISIGQQLQRVGCSGVEIVSSNKVLAEINVLSFEVALYQMRRVLLELQRKRLSRRLKVADRMRRVQFEIDAQMSGGLRLISVRPQRDREI